MSLRHRVLIVGLLMSSVTLGCQHCCKKQNVDRPIGQVPPGALIIGQPIPVNPSGPVPGSAGGPFIGSPNGAGGGQLPPQSLPPSSYYAPPGYTPRTQPELLMPQPIQGTVPSVPSKRPSNANAYIGGLYIGDPLPPQASSAIPPAISESRDRTALSSPLNSIPPPPATVRNQPPQGDAPLSPALPVGIPDFALVKDGISSGQRPDEDGMQWLSDNRYKTVVFLRRPSEDDAMDRKWFESKGITFVSFVVSADRMTPELSQQFIDLLAKNENRPVFVYDTSGPLAGSMWFLYFRTVDRLGADEARARAGRLGLSDQGSDEQNQIWLSMQKILSANP